jgi:hypothetical protein
MSPRLDPQRPARCNNAVCTDPTKPSPTPALTIFTIPKPFHGHVGLIQRNAIQSWTRLVPRPQILLFGREEGVARLADELGLEHVAEIQRNEHGTPLLDGIFRTAHERAVHATMAYLNADIIVLEDFSRAVGRVAATGWDRYLLLGRRTEADVSEAIDFSREDWSQRLLQTVSRSGALAPRVCKDYFVFRKPMFSEIPPFAVGRAVWDSWIVFRARQAGIPVIDATRAVRAIHQNHGYGHAGGRAQVYVKGPEARRNVELAGGGRLVKGSTCTWIMTPRRLRRRWIPSDLLQFALDLHRYLALVCELYGWKMGSRQGHV